MSKPIYALTINGHVGVPFRNGAMEWWLRRHPFTNLVLAQEVRDSDRFGLGLGNGWDWHPADQPGESREVEAMTYVAWRTKAFEFKNGWNRDITFGENHPRRMTAARLEHLDSGQHITAASVHCQPLGDGLVHANRGARDRQTKQLTEYANFLGGRPLEDTLLAGGDFNQQVDAIVPPNVRKHTAQDIFRRAGMRPAYTQVAKPGHVGLIELFVEPAAVEVVWRRTYEIPVAGMDHEVVYTKVLLK